MHFLHTQKHPAQTAESEISLTITHDTFDRVNSENKKRQKAELKKKLHLQKFLIKQFNMVQTSPKNIFKN